VPQAGDREKFGDALQKPDHPGFCVRQMRHATPSLPTSPPGEKPQP
jgi:hypothetical protein